MSNATENVTVKLNADASDLNRLVAGFDRLIAQEKDLLAAFEKTNSAYARQMAELQTLQKLEAQLIDLKNKENNPALLASYNTALDNTAKKIAAIKAAYSAEIAIVDALRAKQNDLKAAMDKATDPANVKRLTAELNSTALAATKLSTGTQNVSGSMLSLGNAVKTAGTLIAAEFAVSRVRQFADAVIDTTAEMQGLFKAIDFLSNGQGEKVFVELERQASTMGLSLKAAASGFRTFSASIGDKMPLEQQLKIFEQINMGLSVMKVTEDKAANAYLALAQMMSKGTVQAEELKGQLGDALPGALGMAAKAMGVTEKALLKMMEKGELMASDFLPKFAAAMEKKFAGGVADASTGIQASINRQDNAWLQLRETLGNVVTPAYQSLMGTTSEWLDIVAKSIAGQQLSVDQSLRVASALDTLRNAISVCIGLFLTMTNAGRAMATNFLGLVRGVGNFTGALYSMATGTQVGTAGLRSMVVANNALNASLTALRGILAGLGIGLAIIAIGKLYDMLTATDAALQQSKEDLEAFNGALKKGSAEATLETEKMNALFEVLKNVNSTQEERADALLKLNSSYAPYLKGLNLEHASLVEIERAQRAATDALLANLQTKLRTKLYEEQALKNIEATQAASEALKELIRVQEIYNLVEKTSFSFVSNRLGAALGFGLGGELKAARENFDRERQREEDSRKRMAELAKQGIELNPQAPQAATLQLEGLSDKEKKAMQERINEEERLARRLAELREQLKEGTIEELSDLHLAQIRFTQDTEIQELESLERRLTAQGKLTEKSKALIGQIKEALIELSNQQVVDVLRDAALAQNEERTQALIADVKQGFIEGGIQTEASMQAQIAAITLDGENKKLAIITQYAGKTEAQERLLQDRSVANTQQTIERKIKLEQENFEARQRFLQQGDYEMQEQALKAHFKRMEAQMIAHNRETQNPLAVNANTGEVGLTKAQRIALERDKLEAELQLNQQHNKELYALGLTRNQQEAMLGQTIRQKEVSELEAYYEKRLELARKSGQDEKAIEAEKAQAMRQLHAKRVETDLGYQQQALGNIQQAAQAASQVVTEQTQNEINMLSQRYDRAISLAQTKAEKDARFYGENSKQARKSAQDLAHVELEKQHAIQKAEDEGHKKQAKLAALNKAIATAQAVISTAMAVVKYLAMTELFPVNIELATAAGIAGAAQVATIIAQPIPQYAKGTPSVKGGTPGRDSVHAMLMPGERVIPTAQNRQYWGALEAIRTGAIPAEQMNGFAMSFGAMAAGPSVPMPRTREPERPWFDDARLVAAIKEKEHVNVNVSADEAGFAVMVERQRSRNRMIDKRFSYNG